MKILLIACLTLLSMASSLQKQKWDDKAILVLGWPDFQCQVSKFQSLLHQCDGDKLALWDQYSFFKHSQSFVIRDFIFPSFSTTFNERRQKQARVKQIICNTRSKYLNNNYQVEFDLQSIKEDQQLYKDLKRYFSFFSFKGDMDNSHWNVTYNISNYHSYAHLHLPKKTISTYTPKELYQKFQSQFFKELISLYRSLKVKMGRDRFTKKTLAKALGVKEENIYIKCNDESFVDRVGVCYAYKKGKYTLTSCEKSWNKCQSEKVFLKNWKIHENTINVYDWKSANQLDDGVYNQYKIHFVVGIILVFMFLCYNCLSGKQQEQRNRR